MIPVGRDGTGVHVLHQALMMVTAVCLGRPLTSQLGTLDDRETSPLRIDDHAANSLGA